MLKLAALSLTL